MCLMTRTSDGRDFIHMNTGLWNEWQAILATGGHHAYLRNLKDLKAVKLLAGDRCQVGVEFREMEQGLCRMGVGLQDEVDDDMCLHQLQVYMDAGRRNTRSVHSCKTRV